MQVFVLAVSLTAASVLGGVQVHTALRDRVRDGHLYENDLSRPERIVGGWETPIEVYPHHIALEAYGFFWCGGSIISETWILTAGHCLYDDIKTESVRDPRNTQIRAGTETKYVGGQVRQVADVFIHPKLNPHRSWDYDLGMMRLETPLDFNEKVSPIPIAAVNQTITHGKAAWTCGWGDMSFRGTSPRHLHAVNIPLWDAQKCANVWGGYIITPRMVCASDSTKSTCQGDSGGALITESDEDSSRVQIGIVSFGYCTATNQPTGFTNVADPEINLFIRQLANL